MMKYIMIDVWYIMIQRVFWPIFFPDATALRTPHWEQILPSIEWLQGVLWTSLKSLHSLKFGYLGNPSGLIQYYLQIDWFLVLNQIAILGPGLPMVCPGGNVTMKILNFWKHQFLMQDTTHQPHGIEQFRSKLVNITSTQLIKHKRIIHFWWVVLIGFHDIHIWVFEGRSVKNRMWSFFLGLVVVCPFMVGKRALWQQGQ